MVRVSVREHAEMLRAKLTRAGTASFRTLCADCQSTLEVVARFLGLLELFREGLVGFAQVEALGELNVRWTGPEDAGGTLEIDEYGDETAEGGAEPAAEGGAEASAGVPDELPTPPAEASESAGAAGAGAVEGEEQA
jgi:segregation and condensation protein A